MFGSRIEAKTTTAATAVNAAKIVGNARLKLGWSIASRIVATAFLGAVSMFVDPTSVV